MAFPDHKIPTFPGINDAPVAPTANKAGNGSNLIAKHNSLCDEVKTVTDATNAKVTALESSDTSEKAKVTTLQTKVAALEAIIGTLSQNYAAISHGHAGYLTKAEADILYAAIGSGGGTPAGPTTYVETLFAGANNTNLNGFLDLNGKAFEVLSGNAAIQGNKLVKTGPLMVARVDTTKADCVVRASMDLQENYETSAVVARVANFNDFLYGGAYIDPSDGSQYIEIGSRISGTWAAINTANFPEIVVGTNKVIGIELKVSGQSAILKVTWGAFSKTISAGIPAALTVGKQGLFIGSGNVNVYDFSVKLA
jgi:hypothetical protein